MSKQFWLHAGLTVLGSAVVALTPAVLQAAAHHPTWSAVLIGGWTLLGSALNPKGGPTQ